MSIFDANLIKRDITVTTIYNVEFYNAAYNTPEQNLQKIFGSSILNHADPMKYLIDFFGDMQLHEFEKLINKFIRRDGDKVWGKHHCLHWWLWRKMGVKIEYLKDAHLCWKDGSWGGDYAIFIPNGESIEYATADGIVIVFKRK